VSNGYNPYSNHPGKPFYYFSKYGEEWWRMYEACSIGEENIYTGRFRKGGLIDGEIQSLCGQTLHTIKDLGKSSTYGDIRMALYDGEEVIVRYDIHVDNVDWDGPIHGYLPEPQIRYKFADIKNLRASQKDYVAKLMGIDIILRNGKPTYIYTNTGSRKYLEVMARLIKQLSG